MSRADSAPLGVVAIGRNEGDRLIRCLRSIAAADPTVTVVYVDSGSRDGSPERAEAEGVAVVRLDPARPFSAARARNEGFARLETIVPGIQWVQFVDGDCEVAPTWLSRARAAIEAKPGLAVVCGRRRERHPEQSIYNRLADLEWDTPIGEASACGGDALMRAEPFRAVGRFNETAAAGEEPELCQRLRAAGWRIERIDEEMTIHDLAMTRFRQWWRRMTRSGYNGLDIQQRFPGEDQPFARELSRARLWAGVWPLTGLLLALAIALAAGPWVGAGVALGWMLILPLRAIRLARKIRPRVRDGRTALGYGWFTVIGQWANLVGQGEYLLDRLRGRTGKLIEYKTPASLATHA